jgi:hypothetical protein
MKGYMNKEALLKWKSTQEGIIRDTKECLEAAWTEESKKIRLETLELEAEMLKLLDGLLEDYRRLDLLLEDMGLKMSEFNPDGVVRKVKCIDAGGNEMVFNYEFASETLKIKSEFGRVIQERFLWSDTFKKGDEVSDRSRN